MQPSNSNKPTAGAMRPQTPAGGTMQKAPLMKQFPKESSSKQTMLLVLGAIVIVLAGVGTGWFFAGSGSSSTGSSKKTAAEGVAPGAEVSDTEAGIEDADQFPDTVEGMLVEGGVENEGTHHLERDGGPSQNVYLSSTIVDLQSFVGKKVQVWGQTLSGTHAGWLMDVGKVRVIE